MVRQFDAYRHPVAASRAAYPFLIVLQHDSVTTDGEVIVAPLMPHNRDLASRIRPIVVVEGAQLLLMTPYLRLVPRRLLRRPVTNRQVHRTQMIAAIDMLFAGS